MATSALALGPWRMTFRLSASVGMAFTRRTGGGVAGCARSAEELVAEGATDRELICLSRPIDIDEARRRWQSEAGLLGIRP